MTTINNKKNIVNSFILNLNEYNKCEQEFKENFENEKKAERNFMLSIGFIEEDYEIKEISDIDDDEIFEIVNDQFSESEEAIRLEKEYRQIVERFEKAARNIVDLSAALLNTNNKDVIDFINKARSNVVYREKLIDTLSKLDVTTI